VHDLFDLAAVNWDLETGEKHTHVMTSWHEDETLDEALWFAVFAAYPGYEGEWPEADTLLAVTVGERAWAEQVARRLRDAQRLSDDVV
jgi:hypothetical protein